MPEDEAAPARIATLPDSPDTRLFVELSSYAADLSEALAALELVSPPHAEDPVLREAELFLVGYAVMAYCRTFFPSQVRVPLTKHVAVPNELAATHTRIVNFRNRTIAHSHSQLTTTLPVAVLWPNADRPRDVLAVTLIQSLPRDEVARFPNAGRGHEGSSRQGYRAGARFGRPRSIRRWMTS